MKDFEKAYKELNPQQKRAVDHLSGPVIVVAGPGTGKTQLLSVRAANILRSTDTKPENILCLTFTNKAAINMQERLISIVGPAANNMEIKTFHSFAAEIMNLYPDYFWQGARLNTVPEAVQTQIVQDILFSLPLEDPLAAKFAGKFSGLKAVLGSIKLAKEAGLTPEQLTSLIEANLAYIDVIEPTMVDVLGQTLSTKMLPELRDKISKLTKQPVNRKLTLLKSLNEVILETLNGAIAKDEGTGKTANTGKWKTQWLQNMDGSKKMANERKRNKWWSSLASVYSAYREQLHERGFYDYADMLVEVLYQLGQNPEMLADIQERFAYVLVDEFQDVNPAQLKMAHLVADHESANGQPNLFVVGDDDQSIFKFNGSQLNNMLNFVEDYKIKAPIVLTDNYRSSQSILDTATKVIEQSQERLASEEGIEKTLSARKAPKKASRIEHIIYPAREYELSAVAREIIQKRKDTLDIAVLARDNESLRQMSAILKVHGLPVRFDQQNNVLELESVRQIVLLARAISAINNGDKPLLNSALSKLLRHPMWGIEPKVLWQMAVDNRNRADWLGSLLGHKQTKLKNLGNWLLWLAQQSSLLPLPVILEHLIGLRSSELMGSPLSAYYAKQKTNNVPYIEMLSAIQLLRHMSEEFSRRNQASLDDFVSLIDIEEDNRLIITDESPFISGENAVNLMSVHKAKGLEFDSVFLIDAIDPNWRPRVQGRKPPANLPLQPYGDDREDYIRLMYVAITRARRDFVAASFRSDHGGKEVLPTPIILGAIEGNEPDVKSLPPAAEVLEENIAWPSLDYDDENTALKPILENYRLSVTALLNFLDITRGGPQYFKEKNLLRLPEVKTVSQAYGTAMHEALQAAQHYVNSSKFSVKKVQRVFADSLKNEHVDPQDFARYKEHGEKMISHLFNTLNYELPPGSLAEQVVNDIILESGAKIGGKLDRMDKTNGSMLTIVDYKTGKPLKNLVTSNKSLEVKAWKHRTQLIFYALLARSQARYTKYQGIEGQMVYVEAETNAALTRTYAPSKKEIDDLEKLVSAVWHKIQKLDLPDVAQYSKDMAGINEFIGDLTK